MLINRMLGGVSSFAMMAPDGVDGGGGGGGEDNRHTDVVLQDIASKAFDDVAASADTAGDTTGAAAPARAAEKPAGEVKPAATAKDAGQGQKSDPGRPGAEDRGDGRRTNGQFARKTPAELAAEAANTGSDLKPAGEQQQLGPDGQPVPVKAAPPGSWSPTSKAAWDKLPPTVQADIAKRELEISNGFRQYEGVKPFAERAAKSGQTLAQALTAYTGIEELVRKDFAGGVMHIAQNAGLTQHEAARVFGQIAQRLGFQSSAPAHQPAGGSSGDQNLAADPNLLQELLKPVLEPLKQKLDAIDTWRSREVEGVKTQRLTQSQQTVETFRQSPEGKYYDNVEQTIGDLLDAGVVQRTGNLAADLKAAYDMACWQNPEIRELLINERSTAAAEERQRQERTDADRARAASRSVTGAPAPGAREQSRRGAGDQLNQLAAQAYDQAAGRV